MKPVNRWTPVARFPITKALYNCFPKNAKKKGVQKPDIVSEKLCDDILQRLSPYLLRKSPVDVLDLWPGAGLWSSKLNDFLRPRRHVLIEPDLKTFEPMLKPLAQSKSCYELLSLDIHTFDDWHGLISKHFPQQGPVNCDNTGPLAKNDTLLVLANAPPNTSKKDHYTPARWWAVLMESCMQQSGLNSYGSVRFLASLPMTEAQAILPRSVAERKRPALLTENVALHAFEIAATQDPGSWSAWKGWDLMVANQARVSQRTAERGVVIPAGREPPPIPMAPESPEPGQMPCPHVPRVKADMHDRIMGTIKAADESKADSDSATAAKAKKTRNRAIIQLNQDNRHAFIRKELGEKQAKLDELTKSLSRSAAHPDTDFKTLQPILDNITAVKTAVTQRCSELHFDVLKNLPSTVDDARATSNFDDALLLWDRRPFEPLHIDPEELYPRGADRAMIYFEADANSPVMQRINQVDPSEKGDLLRLYEALSLTFGNRGSMSVAELLQLMFPTRPINDLVKSIPSLATFASKTPKPDFDNLPKTVHGRPDDRTDPEKTLDPTASFQENLDYDLSDVRIRCLSATTLWEILLEYQKSDMKLSAVQLNRLLGGTLTSFRSGDYAVEHKTLR